MMEKCISNNIKKNSNSSKAYIDESLNDSETKNKDVVNYKKNFRKRKKIIIFSTLIVIVMIIISSLAIIYHPREISKYVKSSIDDFMKIEICHNESTIKIEEEKVNVLLENLLDVKVVPSYIFTEKVVSSYTINLYYKDCVYILNNYYIFDGEKGTSFNPLNDDIYNLVREYIED